MELSLSLGDSDLLEVWPTSNMRAERRKQFVYVNLILQHHWLALRAGDASTEEVEASLFYLFDSPIFREYWQSKDGGCDPRPAEAKNGAFSNSSIRFTSLRLKGAPTSSRQRQCYMARSAYEAIARRWPEGSFAIAATVALAVLAPGCHPRSWPARRAGRQHPQSQGSPHGCSVR